MSLNDLINASRELLDQRDAAAHLGIEAQTLANWRCTRRYALPYIKVGSRVKYRKSDLDEFLAKRTRGGDE